MASLTPVRRDPQIEHQPGRLTYLVRCINLNKSAECSVQNSGCGDPGERSVSSQIRGIAGISRDWL